MKLIQKLFGLSLIASLCVGFAKADELPVAGSKILLIPIDDRPATAQFPGMIGAIAGVQVVTPPTNLLGRFTQAGQPDLILNWLDSQNLSEYDSVILSTDMAIYGGLIASRANNTTFEQANNRLNRIESIKARYPGTKWFGFSAVMRIAPTSTKASASWRERLVRAVVVRDRFYREQDLSTLVTATNGLSRVQPDTLREYDRTRKRNFEVQMDLIRMAKRGVFDHLIVGQDDAQPEGPHIAEVKALRQLAADAGVTSKVTFCEGIDQDANILVSRSILERSEYKPRVRLVMSDPKSATIIAPYESQSIENNLRQQVAASGAIPTYSFEQYDYALFINMPQSRPEMTKTFVDTLIMELDQGFPVAVADINLGKTGTGDPMLYEILTSQNRAINLLGYAGWNTAGNTLGTAIPNANVLMAARRNVEMPPLQRELNHKKFILHRLVNDFEYHRNTRPAAYQLLDRLSDGSRDETYGNSFATVNEFVQVDLATRINQLFDRQMRGQEFYAGTQKYRFDSLNRLEISLPWPRAYEVRIDFEIKASPVGR